MSEYVVVIERADDGGWGAYLPMCLASSRLGGAAMRSQGASERHLLPTQKRWRPSDNRCRTQ